MCFPTVIHHLEIWTKSNTVEDVCHSQLCICDSAECGRRSLVDLVSENTHL